MTASDQIRPYIIYYNTLESKNQVLNEIIFIFFEIFEKFYNKLKFFSLLY